MTLQRQARSHSSNIDLSSERLKGALRQLLRTKKRSYKELADHLGCSLATVKRTLNQEELSLSRLLTICAWLGITLSELEAAAAETQQRDEYTDEQELFLAADPRYLVYLHELFDGATPDEIQKKYGIKKASTDRYLLRLEQAALVRVSAKGRVTPNFSTQPNWRHNGPLGVAYFERMIDTFSNFFRRRVTERMRNPDASREVPLRSTIGSGGMTRESFDEMSKEVLAVIRRYEDLSALETKIKPKDALGYYVLSHSLTWLRPEEGQQELEQIFGRVTDL